VIARDDASHVPLVFLSEDVGLPHAYQWAFYLHERHRDDLSARSRYFSLPISPSAIPSGSLLVFDARDPRLNEITSTTVSSIVRVVNGVSGAPAATVLRKD
jgi:hypothetical protein